MTYNTMVLHSVAVADANGPSLDCEGYSILGVQITGTFTGTVYFEGTVDESTWVSLEAINVASGAKATTATAVGVYRMGVAGLVQARARLDWGSGEVTATGRLSDAADPMLQDMVLSAGAASIGTLGANSGTDIGDVTLNAGTASIGVLGANDGVDIGNVDVTSVPGALQGPGNPTVDSYTCAVVNLAASTADQVLVANAAASKQIWVYGLFMMADTAAGTVTLQDEDDTALSGTMAVSDEGGWVLAPSGNFAMPWIKVATTKALEADTGACTVGGIICYGIVSV